MHTTNKFAVWSLGLGITSIFFNFIGVLSLLAIVLGVVGLKQVKESGGKETGQKAATAGIVLGLISLALLITFRFLVH